MKRSFAALAFLSVLISSILAPQSVFAANITVRPSNMQGWSVTNQDLAATVTIVSDSSAQFGHSSIKFQTGPEHESKAQISNLNFNVPLASVSELSYWTKQDAGNRFGYEIPSYQLRLDMDGTGQYVTDFYYYPSANVDFIWTDVGPTTPDIKIGVWQKWDVLVGKWASYQPIPGTFDSIPELTPGEGGIDSGIAGAARGGGAFYTVADILRKYPAATVVGIGSNLGVFYESSTSYADGISLNNVVYDFENNIPAPTIKSECKKDAWLTFNFVNQGKCIASLLKK